MAAVIAAASRAAIHPAYDLLARRGAPVPPASPPATNDGPALGKDGASAGAAHELNEVNDVEKQLTCPLCLDLFANAQSLNPCGHVLCGTCLLSLLKTANPKCLECTQPIDYARPSVRSTVIDFSVDRFLESKKDQGEIDSMKERRAGWVQLTSAQRDDYFKAAVAQKVELELHERLRTLRNADIRKMNALVVEVTNTRADIGHERTLRLRAQDLVQALEATQTRRIAQIEAMGNQARQMEREKLRLAEALIMTRKPHQVAREESSMMEVGYVPAQTRMGVFSIGTEISVCLGGFLLRVNGSSSGHIPAQCVPGGIFHVGNTVCQGGPACPCSSHSKIFEMPTHLVPVMYGPSPWYQAPQLGSELCPKVLAAQAMDVVRALENQHQYVSYGPFMNSHKLRTAFARRHVIWPVPIPSSPVVHVKDSLWLPWTRRLYPEQCHLLPDIPKDPVHLTSSAPGFNRGKRTKAEQKWAPLLR